jgi:hypothetical protein
LLSGFDAVHQRSAAGFFGLQVDLADEGGVTRAVPPRILSELFGRSGDDLLAETDKSFLHLRRSQRTVIRQQTPRD